LCKQLGKVVWLQISLVCLMPIPVKYTNPFHSFQFQPSEVTGSVLPSASVTAHWLLFTVQVCANPDKEHKMIIIKREFKFLIL
jgi:hypothetical protein